MSKIILRPHSLTKFHELRRLIANLLNINSAQENFAKFLSSIRILKFFIMNVYYKQDYKRKLNVRDIKILSIA